MSTEIQKKHKGEITLNDVRDKIISIQNKNVLLDSDVAWLYGVDTMRINEAVKNNPNKLYSSIRKRRMENLEIESFDFKLGRQK
jgi:hypothetical protein